MKEISNFQESYRLYVDAPCPQSWVALNEAMNIAANFQNAQLITIALIVLREFPEEKKIESFLSYFPDTSDVLWHHFYLNLTLCCASTGLKRKIYENWLEKSIALPRHIRDEIVSTYSLVN